MILHSANLQRDLQRDLQRKDSPEIGTERKKMDESIIEKYDHVKRVSGILGEVAESKAVLNVSIERLKGLRDLNTEERISLGVTIKHLEETRDKLEKLLA